MDCLACQEQFAAMIEHTATEATSLALNHLRGCPDCARQFDGYRRAVQALRDLPLVSPPPSLLPAIHLELDRVSPRRSRLAMLWQPLTAGLSLAACLMLVIWTTVLSPPEASRPVAPLGTSLAAQPRPRTEVAGETNGGRPARLAQPNSMRSRMVAPARGPVVPMPVQSHTSPWSAMGDWAVAPEGQPAPAAQPAAGGGASGKPAGTFAAGDPAPTAVTEPLQRRVGPLQLSFVPPAERAVGITVVGELTIDSEAECEATVGVEARRGLRVVNGTDGVIYRGPIRRGEVLKLPVKLFATSAGTQRLRVWMRPDMPVGEADLDIAIPGFTGRMTEVGETVIDLQFRETPATRAMREMAAAAGARLVIEAEVHDQLVTQDYSAGVPFAAALRILCDSVGCQVEERDGVFHVVK